MVVVQFIIQTKGKSTNINSIKSYNKMKTKFIVLIYSVFFLINANAQQTIHKKAMQDLTPFTGVWIGINNNIKYEITFKEGIRKVELNGIKYTIELIFASSVKWFKNEKLIREFNADAPQSILEGIISETNPLFLSWFNYYDEEKGYNGSGTLTINNVGKSIFPLFFPI